MNRSFSFFSVSALFLLSACASSGEDITLASEGNDSNSGDLSRSSAFVSDESDEESDPVDEGAAAEAPTLTAVNLVGTWSSPACGKRTYPRSMQLSSDGSFESEDFVSPSPTEGEYTWFGVAATRGFYTLEERFVAIKITQEGTGPGVVPFPTTFAIDGASSLLVEFALDQESCVYEFHPAATEDSSTL